MLYPLISFSTTWPFQWYTFLCTSLFLYIICINNLYPDQSLIIELSISMNIKSEFINKKPSFKYRTLQNISDKTGPNNVNALTWTPRNNFVGTYSI